MFILSSEKAEPRTHCVNITSKGEETFSFTEQEEQTASIVLTDKVGEYLYEPHAAIQKAGCHRTLAQVTQTKKLHPNSHLYTADREIPDFPGRKFKVEKVLGFTKNELKELAAMGKANITIRNFPESVQQLRKRLKLAEGGEKYIFATTLANESKVLAVCERI